MSEAAKPGASDAVTTEPAAPPVLRQLTDPMDMRGLAHPIRLALLEVLAVHGPLTATQAGELIGESPSSCSFHLRTLARHNFVEETGDGRGRQRPWRLVTLGLSIQGIPSGSETFVAAEAVSQIAAERQIGRLRQWWARRRTSDQSWLDAAINSQFVTWLTPTELREINEAVFGVLARHHERLGEPSKRPPGSELVELLYFAYPASFGHPPDAAEDDSPSANGSTGAAAS